MNNNGNYQSIMVKDSPGIKTVIFNRLSHRNSINGVLIEELNEILTEAEHDLSCRIVILEGQAGIFCTGMDFEEVVSQEGVEQGKGFTSEYLKLLKRFTLSPKIIISKIDGQAMAGGVGLAVASDLAIATPRSQFNLSEALWGLLPAMVIPFLIRRVGFQKAYTMTLTTMPITAQAAFETHLIDELSDRPDESVQRYFQRLIRVDESTVTKIKQYFRKMWLIDESVEETAVNEITARISDPKVQENIRNFTLYKKFPWEV